jgi:tetratricopeptide (TPR) repeat protein
LVKGDVEQALPLFEDCAELAERADLPVLVMHLGTCLGPALCVMGRPAEAVTLIEKARALEDAGGNMLWMPLNLAALAIAYSLVGCQEQALRADERARECARRFGQRGNEAWAFLTGGEVFARCRPDEPVRAIDAYRAALALGTELKMRPLVARSHLGLATLPGPDRSERRRSLDTATALFREMGMRSWLTRAEGVRAAL